ncbi:MAG: T9SS type B sorting domain-containing protein, partial [Bacteroidia bacterium]
VINNPNTLGVGCNYVANGVSTAPGTSQYGLPTFIQSYLKVPPPPFTSTMSCLSGSFAAPSITSLNQGCTTSTVNPVQSYLWNFGDPASGPTNTSNIANPTHLFSGPGTYTVKLVLGYGCGGDTITGVVTAVSCGPNVQITGQSICPSACTTISATASGGTGPYSYTWTPNIGSGPGPFTVCPGSTTIYSVTIADVTNTTANDTAIVVINPIPTIAVTNPTACTNDSFTLTANGGTAYAWTGPNSFTSNLQNPVLSNVTSSETGNYTVTVTSSLGCTNAAVAAASVIPLPNITIGGGNSLCAQSFNGSQNFVTLSASGISSYSWIASGGLAAPANLNTSPITFTAHPTSLPTIETLTLSGTLGSCTNTTTYTVAIVPNPTITVSSASMCSSSSTVLVAAGADTYSWSGPSLNATTGSSVIASPAVTSIYSVYGSSLNCQSATENSTVTVMPSPSLLLAPNNATVCSGSGVNLNAVGANSYTWSPSGSLNTPVGQAVIASPLSTTNYTVTGEVNTCTSTAVVQVSVIPLPNLIATVSKTAVCAGESVNLNSMGASSYTWSPSAGMNNPFSNFVTLNPNVSTTYTIVGENGICAGFATVAVNVIPLPQLNLSTNLNKICRGNNTTIFASGAQFYNWSPNTNVTMLNDGTANVSPNESTNYTVTGYNDVNGHSCAVTKEILIEVVPQVTAVVGGTFNICEGETVRLNANGGNNYSWLPTQGLENPSVASPYASPKFTTIYTVNVTNSGNCGATGTVIINVNPTPKVDAGEDFVVNLDEPMYLNGSGEGTLTWISGEGILCKVCPNTQIMPNNSGNYVIEAVTPFGCKSQDEVHVVVTKDHNVYIPNIFTPNDDGVNDVFLVYGTGIVEIEMIIFDRWGEKLFTSTDQLKGWTGYYKGELSKNDAYVYKITYKALDGKKYTKTGHVTLMK